MRKSGKKKPAAYKRTVMRAKKAKRIRKKKKGGLIPVLLAAAAVFCVFGLMMHERKQSLIPEAYRAMIQQSSEQYDIPIEILYAVIKTESNFVENARSSAGACGLMQLMPDTFNWLQVKRGESLESSLIFDPQTNIDYGSSYLAMLYEQFHDWDIVFAAYNAGPSIVSVWLEASSNGKLSSIPYKETEQYVEKVNRAIQEYKSK